MKKMFLLIVGIIVFLPAKINAIETSATSAILMDMDSKRILYAKDINNRRSVASISKIMTAIVAIENSNIKSKVTVGDEINSSYGSGIYIKIGEVLTLEDLLYGLMLRSGNDASYAIAKYVGGSVDKFIKMMNDTAAHIGMTNSTFNNPNGLDEDKANYSTAYDMALLTSYAMQNKDYKKITSTTKYILKTNMNTYIWHNKHKLIGRNEYVTGGKTGFTQIARRTLVTTASKDNLNLVVVTLNDGNDWSDHENLFEYGFNNYKSYNILKKGNIEIEDDYYKGYEFYINNDYNYPLSSNELDSINIKFELEKVRKLKDDIKVGVAKVLLGDEVVHEEDIYINEIKKGNKKLGLFDKIKRWFKNLW